jgi:hypothetical protein
MKFRLFFTFACFFLFAEVFNDVMFTQTDDQMIGLWEYQWKGLA